MDGDPHHFHVSLPDLTRKQLAKRVANADPVAELDADGILAKEQVTGRNEQLGAWDSLTGGRGQSLLSVEVFVQELQALH